MINNEVKKYLKDNLKIDIEYEIFKKKIVLKLEDEIISSIDWPIF